MKELVNTLFAAASDVLDGYVARLPDSERQQLMRAMTEPNVGIGVVVDMSGAGVSICVNGSEPGPIVCPIRRVPPAREKVTLN